MKPINNFKEVLNSETNKIEAFEICLRNRPVIEASCYLPLNASIVVHLFRVDDTLPNTLHGVFLNLVINCIVRHILREGHEPPRISSLDDLPPDIQTQLSHICAMAYHGVMENKVTFSEDDLKSFNLPPDISTLSLIQGVESFMATYKLRSYNFLHLSVQELLSSYHISKLTPEEQVKIFKDLFDQPRFAAVFQYYAAFTKLQTAGIQDIIVSIIQRKNKPLLLTLLHCLYEAQDSSLCQILASELKGQLELSNNSLSPVDCIAVGYFLHQCATICPMTAKLSQCSLDSYKLELLGKELKRPIQAVQFEVCIDFSSSSFGGNLTRLIATELIATASEGVSIISKLVLSDNPIRHGEDGLSHLCQALTTNTSLVELNLSYCKLIITEENGQALSHMLKTNKTLNVFVISFNSINGRGARYLSEGISSSSAINKLDLSYNPIQRGEDGLSHLCQALTTNTSLVELTLTNCELIFTEENGQALSLMLKTNKTLKIFTLLSNSINGRGVCYLSKGISSSSAISKLDLKGNPIQDDKDGLSHLCQALKTNTSLVELNLSYCKLHEACGPALRHMLETNKTLTSLDLSHNFKIKSHNVASIAEGLSSNHSLKCLDLRWCDIHDTGMKRLTDCLMMNNSLEELDLRDNIISAEAARGFSDMLKRVNSPLKKLNVSGCELTDAAVKSLASALEVNPSLEELDLSGNFDLTDTALVALGESLKRNTGLKRLELGTYNDRTTVDGWRQFVQCLKDNHSLVLLRTHHRELDVEDINTVRREKDLPELHHKYTYACVF